MKEKMSAIEYSESFINKGQQLLREMAESNKLESAYGEPFSNFYVIIGETDKTVVAVLEVPEDLKEKVGDKAYVVTD